MDNQIVDFIVTKGPWVLSFIAILQTYLQGEKLAVAWLVTGLNQLGWYLWIFLSGNYGFVILTTFLLLLSVRNYFKWRNEGLKPVRKNKLDFICGVWLRVDYNDTENIPWGYNVQLLDGDTGEISTSRILLRENYSPEKLEGVPYHFYRFYP